MSANRFKVGDKVAVRYRDLDFSLPPTPAVVVAANDGYVLIDERPGTFDQRTGNGKHPPVSRLYITPWSDGNDVTVDTRIAASHLERAARHARERLDGNESEDVLAAVRSAIAMVEALQPNQRRR